MIISRGAYVAVMVVVVTIAVLYGSLRNRQQQVGYAPRGGREPAVRTLPWSLIAIDLSQSVVWVMRPMVPSLAANVSYSISVLVISSPVDVFVVCNCRVSGCGCNRF